MEQEIWTVYVDNRNVKWKHKHLYEVSNAGRAKIDGVLVDFVENGRYWMFYNDYLHKIVAKIYVPNPDNKPYVDHIDTNIYNNRADNLRWVTAKENSNNPLTVQHIRQGNINAVRPQIKEETIQKLREIAKRPDVIEKKRQAALGNKSNTGKVWIHLGDKNTLVFEEYLDYWLDDGWVLGRAMSPESRANLGKTTCGRHIHLGNVSKRVHEEDLQEWLDKGWSLGRGKLKKYIKE